MGHAVASVMNDGHPGDNLTHPLRARMKRKVSAVRRGEWGREELVFLYTAPAKHFVCATPGNPYPVWDVGWAAYVPEEQAEAQSGESSVSKVTVLGSDRAEEAFSKHVCLHRN